MLLPSRPTTPGRQRHQALPPDRFRLIPFRSPLLRESLLLSSPRGTQMFQFPRFPPLALCVHTRVTPHDGCGVPPFGHPRIEARSAAPRGLSQPPTSFIGIRRQGIHRWLFIAWKNTSLTKMLVLAIEFSRSHTTRTDHSRDATRPRGRRHPPRPPPTGETRASGAFPQNGTEEENQPTDTTRSEAQRACQPRDDTNELNNERSTRECTRHDNNTSSHPTVSSLERR